MALDSLVFHFYGKQSRAGVQPPPPPGEWWRWIKFNKLNKSLLNFAMKDFVEALNLSHSQSAVFNGMYENIICRLCF